MLVSPSSPAFTSPPGTPPIKPASGVAAGAERGACSSSPPLDQTEEEEQEGWLLLPPLPRVEIHQPESLFSGVLLEALTGMQDDTFLELQGFLWWYKRKEAECGTGEREEETSTR